MRGSLQRFALSLNGANGGDRDYVSFGSGSQLQPIDAFTFFARLLQYDGSAGRTVATHGKWGTDQMRFSIGQGSPYGHYNVRLAPNGVDGTTPLFRTPLGIAELNGQPEHSLAAVFDGRAAAAYRARLALGIDGKHTVYSTDNGGVISGTIPASLIVSSEDLVLGQWPVAEGETLNGITPWHGRIWDVQMWERALSDAELLAVHNGEVIRRGRIIGPEDYRSGENVWPNAERLGDGALLPSGTGPGWALVGWHGRTAEGLIVAPVGDSVHEGSQYAGGRRVQFYNRAWSEGIPISFAGSRSNGPAELNDRRHESQSGRTIQQMTTAAASAGWAHVYWIAGGATNSLLADDSLTATALRDLMRSCVRAHLAINPDAHVMLGGVVHDSGASRRQRVLDYHALLPALADEFVPGRVVVADPFPRFAAGGGDFPDLSHPGRAGYDKEVSDVWWPAFLRCFDAIHRRFG